MSVTRITTNLRWWQTLPFQTGFDLSQLYKNSSHGSYPFKRRKIKYRRAPPERPEISIVRCSLPACDLCWSSGDIVFMSDSTLDPLKYSPCITEIATWFYIPNLWLLHRLLRQHSSRKSYQIKEKHFCFCVTVVYLLPLGTSWDQKGERCWLLEQLLSAL